MLPSVELENNDAMLEIGGHKCPIFQENDIGSVPDFEYREVFISEHELSKYKRLMRKIYEAPFNLKPMVFYDSLMNSNKPRYVARIPKDINFSGYNLDGVIHYYVK